MMKNLARLLTASFCLTGGWAVTAEPQTTDPANLEAPVSRTVLSADEPAAGPDEAIWALYAEGRVSEAYAALAEREGEAPADLITAIGLLHDTERLLNAASVGQWALVLSILNASPDVLSCDRPDVIWTAAEAVYRKMSQEAGMEMMARNLVDGCLIGPETRRDAVLMTSLFATPEQISALRDAVKDESLDQSFDEAAMRADAQLVARWTTAAPTPIYSRADAELVEGSRPIPDLLGGEGAVSSTILVSAGVPDAGTAASAARLSSRAKDLSTDQLMSLAWFLYASGDPMRAAEMFRSARPGLDDQREALRGEALSLLAYEDYVEAEAVMPEAGMSGWERDETYLITASQLVSHADRAEGDPLKRGETTLDADQAGRIRQAAAATNDPELEQELGWHSHRLAGCEPALPWWRATLKASAEIEPAAFGLAICLPQGGDESNALRAEWSPKSRRIAELFGDAEHTASAVPPRPRPVGLNTNIQDGPLDDAVSGLPRIIVAAELPEQPMADQPPSEQLTSDQPASASPQKEPTPKAAVTKTASPQREPSASSKTVATTVPRADRCAAGVSPGSLSPQDALARGWCMMEAGRSADALAAFERAMSGGGSVKKDAAYGKSLVNLREGDYKAADAELRRSPQTDERRKEVAASILAQQAIDTLKSNPRTAVEALKKRTLYAEETPELMVLRGWALHKAGRVAAARDVWIEAERLGSKEATKALRDSIED